MCVQRRKRNETNLRDQNEKSTKTAAGRPCVHIQTDVCLPPGFTIARTQKSGSQHHGLHVCNLLTLSAVSAKAKGPRDTPGGQHQYDSATASRTHAAAGGSANPHMAQAASHPLSPNQRDVNRMPLHTSWQLSAWLGSGGSPHPAHFLQLGPSWCGMAACLLPRMLHRKWPLIRWSLLALGSGLCAGLKVDNQGLSSPCQ